MTLDSKYQRLREILEEMSACALAFSGGVDSTFLLAVAADVLEKRVLALIATSATYPERELLEAKEFAERIGVKHKIIASEELYIPEFKTNPPDRCYYCKRELFTKLRGIADSYGINFLLDGSNADDINDHRPGRKAVAELGVRSPLEEAGLTKDDIRRLSRALNLPTWDKPTFACLASRFPYGVSITPERLRQVGKAEDNLNALGFRTLRVRYHGDVARLELGKPEYEAATGHLRAEVIESVKKAGFTYVAVDLQGYRLGAMNEVIIS